MYAPGILEPEDEAHVYAPGLLEPEAEMMVLVLY